METILTTVGFLFFFFFFHILCLCLMCLSHIQASTFQCLLIFRFLAISYTDAFPPNFLSPPPFFFYFSYFCLSPALSFTFISSFSSHFPLSASLLAFYSQFPFSAFLLTSPLSFSFQLSSSLPLSAFPFSFPPHFPSQLSLSALLLTSPLSFPPNFPSQLSSSLPLSVFPFNHPSQLQPVSLAPFPQASMTYGRHKSPELSPAPTQTQE